MERSSRSEAEGQDPIRDAAEAQNACLREEARLAVVEGEFADPLPETHLPLYRRGRGLLRSGFSPVAVRIALREQAPSEGLTADQGEAIALRLLAAPELDENTAEKAVGMIATRLQLRENPRPLPAPVIGDVLRECGMFELLGDVGLGKTWALAWLACAGCCGSRWFDLPVVQGKVLFITAEMLVEEVDARITVLLDDYVEKGILPPNAHRLVDENLLLWGPEFIDDMGSLVTDEALEAVRLAIDRHLPRLLLIDTLADAVGDEVNENRAESIGPPLRAIRRLLRREHRCAAVFAHHPNKNPEAKGLARSRGSGVLPALITTGATIEELGGGVKRLAWLKARGAAMPATSYFTLDDETGAPHLTERPPDQEERRDRMVETLFDLLDSNPSDGLHWTEAKELMPVNPRTGKPPARASMFNYYRRLEAAKRARTVGDRWHAETGPQLVEVD